VKFYFKSNHQLSDIRSEASKGHGDLWANRRLLNAKLNLLFPKSLRSAVPGIAAVRCFSCSYLWHGSPYKR